MKNGYFVPFFYHFPPIFCPIFLNHILPQPSVTHIPCAMPDPHISTLFPDSNILVVSWWVGEFGGGERGCLAIA